MRSIFKYIEAIAKTNLPILVTGETGVGKELIAMQFMKLVKELENWFPLMLQGLMIICFPTHCSGIKKELILVLRKKEEA